MERDGLMMKLVMAIIEAQRKHLTVVFLLSNSIVKIIFLS